MSKNLIPHPASLKTIGEFGLIAKIRKMTKTDSSVLLGIGDDTAVIRWRGKEKILFTTDMLIEDQHFRLTEASGFEIGWKAMAVNISDIAAMGGLPTHAVAAVGLPRELAIDFVEQIYLGIQTAAKRFDVNIVGGDTNASKKLVISVALLGTTVKHAPLTRSGAKSGDVVFVTGKLGGSYASKKHLNFTPRILESQFLINNFNIHSMMDISDGLMSDIHRIARASRVGVVLSKEAIPISQSALNFEEACTGGEDFELLFTLPPKEAARLTFDKKPKALVSFCPVGKIVPKKYGMNFMKADGGTEPLLEKGYNHFHN
ncbi:MAG: thiamine-phosphate kinase [Candidatus Omnitrophica bacterium CG1_02_46_14]|nr:MAG: thiamine-phosphate kinase [Candidatus Omnitrophica bacterium CG1_02_46_14]